MYSVWDTQVQFEIILNGIKDPHTLIIKFPNERLKKLQCFCSLTIPRLVVSNNLSRTAG